MINNQQIETFKIVGIKVRTRNENKQSQTDLDNLWSRFYAENIAHSIPNKSSNNIYSIYTEYKSDFTKAYTAFLGCKVNTLENIPEGLTGLEITGGKYKKFVAKGKLPDAVVNTWMEIWEKNDQLNRKYTMDFEVYGLNSQDPENAEVEIYIAV